MARNTCENMLTNDIRCHREPRYVIGHRAQDNMGDNGDRPTRKPGGHAQSTHFGVGIWLKVCGTCDRQIGRRNLVRLGWSLQEAIQWERDPDMGTPLAPLVIDSPYARQKGQVRSREPDAWADGSARQGRTVVVGSN